MQDYSDNVIIISMSYIYIARFIYSQWKIQKSGNVSNPGPEMSLMHLSRWGRRGMGQMSCTSFSLLVWRSTKSKLYGKSSKYWNTSKYHSPQILSRIWLRFEVDTEYYSTVLPAPWTAESPPSYHWCPSPGSAACVWSPRQQPGSGSAGVSEPTPRPSAPRSPRPFSGTHPQTQPADGPYLPDAAASPPDQARGTEGALHTTGLAPTTPCWLRYFPFIFSFPPTVSATMGGV